MSGGLKLGRYNDRDRDDIRHLVETRTVDANTLIAFYQSARLYYVGRLEPLDQTFNIVLEEHFGREPIDFSR